jgi:HD superfamily phosphohydrolase
MFQHALIYLFENNELAYEDFIRMDDLDLVYKLRNSKGYSKKIMQRIDDRNLFKIFFQEKISSLTEHFRGGLYEEKNELEEQIAQDFNIPKGFLLLDIPEIKLSEFRILIETNDDEHKKLKMIDEVSVLARALEKSEWEKLTFCLYTAPEYKKKLKNFNPEKYIEFSQTRLEKFF